VSSSPHTTTLGEKYALVRALGHGGMGSVYEVENLVTHRRAALKRLHMRFDDVDDAESRRRVIHEARAMARVRHRNVVDVYDVFEDKGRVCLVMELLVGELLSKRVARGGIALHSYVAWLLDAMRGVAAAHAAGVIHRDIKPENIFLAEDGTGGHVPIVIDFGVSKLHAHEHEPRVDGGTRSGIAMGTPRYVSYEQLRGVRDIDGRTDVYAFGVMLYEAIVGVAPYEATTFAEQAICFLTTEPARVCDRRPLVPPALGALVQSAIARRREERPASMLAFVEALLPFASLEAYEAELTAFPLAQRSPSAVTEPSDVEALARANLARIGDAPELPTTTERTRRGGVWLRPVAIGAGLGAGALASLALLYTPPPRATQAEAPRVQASTQPAEAQAARVGATLSEPSPPAARAPRPVDPPAARAPSPARLGVRAAVTPARSEPVVAVPLPAASALSPRAPAPRAGPMSRREF
jgi:eukaryotic-like serine/threonine-protein kinase